MVHLAKLRRDAAGCTSLGLLSLRRDDTSSKAVADGDVIVTAV
jgi:hypothetical protein